MNALRFLTKARVSFFDVWILGIGSGLITSRGLLVGIGFILAGLLASHVLERMAGQRS